jgi:hypothetical protein
MSACGFLRALPVTTSRVRPSTVGRRKKPQVLSLYARGSPSAGSKLRAAGTVTDARRTRARSGTKSATSNQRLASGAEAMWSPSRRFCHCVSMRSPLGRPPLSRRSKL